MRKAIGASVLAAALIAAAGEARADEDDAPPKRGWGLYTGDTISPRNGLIFAELGFPGPMIGFKVGATDWFDVGLTFGTPIFLQYTFSNFSPGFEARVPLRFNVVRGERVSFLVHVDPGVKVDMLDPLYVGPQIPIGMLLGVHATPRTSVGFGFDMPIFANLKVRNASGSDRYYVVPMLLGASVEYLATNRFSIGANTRFGPVINWAASGHAAPFGFLLQLLMAVRLGS
jgi:hypothetical protein